MSSGREDVVLRSLSGNDEPALASFSCRTFGQPWTDPVEELIQENLANALRRGNAEAVGLWRGDELVGVAAWRIEAGDPILCDTILVAVASGSRRRGYGRILKQHAVERAREVGAAAVISTVHWDNDSMIELNVSLGANVERIPGDLEYCRCVIPL